VAIGFPHGQQHRQGGRGLSRTRFAIVDMVVDRCPTCRASSTASTRAAFLVGILAAMASRTGKVGFVGGQDIPLVRKFLCGYEQGAAYAVPQVKVISAMTGTTPQAWVDPVRGGELAKAQIAQGADVVLGRGRHHRPGHHAGRQGRRQTGHRCGQQPEPPAPGPC
jgi:basic membrane protein A